MDLQKLNSGLRQPGKVPEQAEPASRIGKYLVLNLAPTSGP
jgi:hypothetical protein